MSRIKKVIAVIFGLFFLGSFPHVHAKIGADSSGITRHLEEIYEEKSRDFRIRDVEKRQMIYMLMSFSGYIKRGDNVERRDVIRDDTLQQEAEYNDYRVKIYRDLDLGTYGVVRIFHKDKLVFEEQGHKYYLNWEGRDSKVPELGRDITGDGKPNLVVFHWSGGAHCCYDVYIFSIGDKFRFVDKIEGEHGFVGFKDLDGDGALEFTGYDWAFAYWNESFAASPFPRFILKYQNGRYRLAYDLMAKPVEQIQEEFKERRPEAIFFQDPCLKERMIWRKGDVCVNSDLWAYMLELIYGGHPQKAWDFLNQAWEYGREAKEAFLADFKSQLAISDYSCSLPVDLKEYKPPAGADKRELRFEIYFNAVMESYRETQKELKQD